MIPAPHGVTAMFTIDEGPPRRVRQEPVIAFDQAGEALVMSEDSRRLVQAVSRNGYYGLSRGQIDATAIMPSDGWRVRYPDGSDRPLVGWGLFSDGAVLPLVLCDNQRVYPVEALPGLDVYHPSDHTSRRRPAEEESSP